MARNDTLPRILLADHQRLHALLAQAQAGESLDTQAFAMFRQGLLRHIAIEEKILFPAAREVLGNQIRWRELRVEHAALTSLLVPTPDRGLLGEIALLLRDHDAREEGASGLYAEIERVLPAEHLRQLATRAAALPLIPVRPHQEGPGVHRTRASALESAGRLRFSSPATQARKGMI